VNLIRAPFNSGLDIIAIGRSPFYFNLIPSVGSKADVAREWQLKSVKKISIKPLLLTFRTLLPIPSPNSENRQKQSSGEKLTS
jgi:hypothetical protein